MSKILYGVSGEGSGHSSRTSFIAEHLTRQGHEIKIVSYDRGYRNLKEQFDAVEISGLTIVSQDNKVSTLRTIKENLRKLPQGARTLSVLKNTFSQFKPDCVITDFEPCTAYLANHYRLPLISLDNQHRMRYMKHPIPPRLKKDALVTKAIIKAMIPSPWVSLITTFHYSELENQHSFLFPPILRNTILDTTPTKTDNILVYATSGFDSLTKQLKTFPREHFNAYGYNKEETDQNIHYKPFSKDGFIKDLKSCKAVMATAGFTLISEALHLAKPYLAFPMQGQFEQQLNAEMLAQHQYGAQSNAPSRETIATFLYDLPELTNKLLKYPRQGNGAITSKLDELLANDLALLKTFKR